jgi:hypothetical protein
MHDVIRGEKSTTFEDLYDRYRSSLNRLEVYFRDPITTELSAVRTQTDKFHDWRKSETMPSDWEDKRKALKRSHIELARRAEETLEISRLSQPTTGLFAGALVLVGLVIAEIVALWFVLKTLPTPPNKSLHGSGS